MRSEGNKIILYNGDCLIESDKIESGSVDLILTDLPYGVVKMKESAGNYKVLNTAETWDKANEPKAIYDIANRILRKNGKMILFSQEPYTSRMITEAIPNVPFSYRAIWEKNDFANGLGVNKAMVSFYEDILLFSKNTPKHDFEGLHPPFVTKQFIEQMDRTVVEAKGEVEAFISRRLTEEGKKAMLGESGNGIALLRESTSLEKEQDGEVKD